MSLYDISSSNGSDGLEQWKDFTVYNENVKNLLSVNNENITGLLNVNNINVTGSSNLPSGIASYADFFALMPGDNASTIAVGAPLLFPQDGVVSSGIVRLSSSTFQLNAVGTYLITFYVSFDEAGQMCLSLNGGELPNTVVGRATGTNQIYGSSIVSTVAINAVLSVVNPAGNSTALTITPTAGGVDAVSAHLVILRIA